MNKSINKCKYKYGKNYLNCQSRIKYQNKKLEFIVKIIFLTGHRKYGTTLLSNLLDNVNGLCVYPTDLALLYAYYHM